MVAGVVVGVAIVSVISATMNMLIVHQMEVLRNVMPGPVQMGVSNSDDDCRTAAGSESLTSKSYRTLRRSGVNPDGV